MYMHGISLFEINAVHVLVAGGQSEDEKPRPDPALEAGNALPPRLIDEFPPEYLRQAHRGHRTPSTTTNT